MKPTSLSSRTVAGLVLAATSVHCWATPTDLIELSGQAGFSCFAGSGTFEGQCGTDESAPFSLVYDPLTPDTDQNPDTGTFKNTIRSFSMTVSQVNRPDLVFSLVGRGTMTVGLSSDDDTVWVSWSMTLKEKNNVVAPSQFYFNTIKVSSGINPNQLPTVDYWTEDVDGYLEAGAGVEQTDWLGKQIEATNIPRPLPAPTPIWLLLIGAAAGLLQHRFLRRK